MLMMRLGGALGSRQFQVSNSKEFRAIGSAKMHISAI